MRISKEKKIKMDFAKYCEDKNCCCHENLSFEKIKTRFLKSKEYAEATNFGRDLRWVKHNAIKPF